MCYLFALLLFGAPAAADEPAIAIRNATVETMAAAGRLERATIVVRNGKLEAVGKNAAIPEDAHIIDAAGGTVMPGIIDPHFEVAIAAAADTGTRTVVIGGRTITLPAGGGRASGSFTRVADNFYPYDAGYKPLPRIGLTRINLVTGGAGQAAVVRVTPGEPEGMLDRADGIAFVSVSNQTDSLDQVRTRLEGAARAKSGGTGSGSGSPFGRTMASTAGVPLWADVHDGKTPLIATVANSATVLHLLKAVEPYKNVKLTIVASGATTIEALDALKGRSVRIIIRPGIELLPNTRDRFAPARLLQEAGIDFSFSLTARPPAALPGAGPALPDGTAPAGADDNPALQDFPLFPVAMMVKAGLPRKMALEALTKRPAAMLGLEATHGTIEPGKVADLLLFTGDPLDPASRLRLTLIDGRTTYAHD